MPSVAQILFTGLFTVLALWCVITVGRPDWRFSAVTRVAGRELNPTHRRVVASMLAVFSVVLAVGAWVTVK